MSLFINSLFIFSIVMLVLAISYFFTAAKEVRKGFKKNDDKVKSEDKKAYVTLTLFFITFAISFVLGLIFY